MSADPAEVLGLTQSIAYAEHLAAEAGLHGPDGNESYLARLAACRVTGDGLVTGSAMQQAFAAAAAAAAGHAAELAKQTTVQEAYDQAPDAGDKTYLTGDTTSGTKQEKEQEKEEAPVIADDTADTPFEVVAGFINATNRSHRQRKPAGQDLQIRMREADGPDNPWISLRIRSTAACDHQDSVCARCLDSWEAGHEMRIAAVPVAVDLDSHRGGADEFYTFEGDPERDLPPYWVARHGRTVTSQIEGEPVATVLLRRDDFASAEFAEGCCDNTPGAPGEVRAGDRIEVFGNHPGGERELTVTASTAADGGYTVTGTDGDDRPVSVTVEAWLYKIARRPVRAAR
jgi:hypothetical protein